MGDPADAGADAVAGSPRFSVVIPTLNRAGVLANAVRSVLAQTYADLELIIVDDGSTDDTAAVVHGFDDGRVRYQPQRRAGVSAARNAGAAAARGEFLVFLDSDDEMEPAALEVMHGALETHAWDAVLGARIMASPDRLRWRTVVPRRLAFVPGAFAIRRSTYADVQGYDPQLAFGENTAFGWRVRSFLTANGRAMGVVEEPTVVVFTRANRDYDLAKYDSARRILEGYDDALGDSLGGVSSRQRRATYEAIAAVGAAQLGNRREAYTLIAKAIANDPFSLKRYRNLARVVLTSARRTRAEPVRPRDTGPATRSTAQPGDGAVHVVTVAGMGAALAGADDNDWIVVQRGGGESESAALPSVPDLGVWLLSRGAPVGALGRRGLQFDRRSGRFLPWEDRDLTGPVTVDAIDVDDFMVVRVAAARTVGGFDADLSCGFDAVDYCLRLQRAGFGVYVDGPAARALGPRADPRRDLQPRRRGPEPHRAPAPIRVHARAHSRSVPPHVIVPRRQRCSTRWRVGDSGNVV